MKVDREMAAKTVKPIGILALNDYVTLDATHGNSYGVVPAVNELIITQGWRVVGFALHHTMCGDITISR